MGRDRIQERHVLYEDIPRNHLNQVAILFRIGRDLIEQTSRMNVGHRVAHNHVSCFAANSSRTATMATCEPGANSSRDAMIFAKPCRCARKAKK